MFCKKMGIIAPKRLQILLQQLNAIMPYKASGLYGKPFSFLSTGWVVD